MKKTKPLILVINGPNLNLLGVREKSIYGAETIDSINKKLLGIAKEHDINIDFFQSNHEGAIVDKIHQAHNNADFLIINPAAYTHTSIAIRDAILATKIPTIEIHLSNIYAREEFRHHSFISPVAKGIISGFGPHSYVLALNAAMENLSQKK